ncbi:protein DENND6A-like isoform X2 [Varroa jacobsoni]|uniref:protein DENND6A-like isoform X2 n=1 Tax=Varroa jacobsoni TaxID=62625 RepID=UPI000BFA09F8|nr:protein DENND6A-like isoform X2 [Varroa jacobsoni]
MPAFTDFGKKALLSGCGCCCEPRGAAPGPSPMELHEMRYVPRRPNELALDDIREANLSENKPLDPVAAPLASFESYLQGQYPLPMMSPTLSGCTLSSSDQQWERYSQWLHCIAVVTFDLELGQAIESVYPPCATLSEQEKLNICYLAFPDSNSACMGDTQFHFRIRREDVNRSRRLTEDQMHFNDMVPPALQIDIEYLYGFAYFRQVKDPSIRRGYFQKSVVFIAHLPLVNLFHKTVALVAPDFFENGLESLETACHIIDRWPPPLPGKDLVLPLNGVVLQCRIPLEVDSQLQSTNSILHLQKCTRTAVILSSVHEPDLFRSVAPILNHVQLLWELVITCEPIVVMANSPCVCSELVQSLVSLVWPLRFCSDFRPFFTIHDSEFKEYTARENCLPAVILGVTNPFFTKTFQHWPHIIKVGEDYSSMDCCAKYGGATKTKRASNLKTLDTQTGVFTQYRPLLRKDKGLLKGLWKGIQTKRPSEVQSAVLRRYFLELTQSFMIPLERYMTSLMPLQKNLSPYKGTPLLKPFNPDDFLATLDTAGPQLTTGIKGEWADLYRKFFRSRNFHGWYQARHREVSENIEKLHIEVISETNLLGWARSRHEVEVIDLVLKLKAKLELIDKRQNISRETACKLKARLEDLIATLPADLHDVLNKDIPAP